MIQINRLFIVCIFILFNSFDLLSQAFTLTEEDISGKQSIALEGNWLFYPETLTFDGRQQVEPEIVYVPSHRSNIGRDKIKYGIYTASLRETISHNLGLEISNINGAVEIYVNESLAFSKGKIGTSRELSKPERKTALIDLSDYGDGYYTLTIKVSNFHHSRAGIDEVLRVGTYQEMLQQRKRQNAFDFFLGGSLLVGSFFFLGLFFFGRTEKMALFFAFFCIFYAYRILGWGNYPLHEIVNIPYFISIRLEYSSLYLCGVFFALYVKNLFPKETPKMIVDVFIGISLAFAVSTLLPVQLFTTLNYPYLIILLVGVILMIVIYIRAAINKRIGSNYAVYGAIFILLVFSVQLLDYIKIIEERRYLSMFAQLAFLGFQSLILSRHFAFTWIRAKDDAEAATRELQDAQAQLVESEKMASLGVLTAGLAHELNNPLNIIRGVIPPLKNDVQEMRSLYLSADRDQESFDTVYNEVNDLLNGISAGGEKATMVIRNLLNMAPNSSDAANGPIDIGKLINETVFLIQKGNPDVKFTIELDHRLITWGNNSEITQIFLNILKNCLDAIRETEDAEIRFENLLEDSYFVISLSDNGQGMDQKTMTQIFEPFFTTKGKENGTGLGLYISRSLIIKNGGSISVESRPGKGTTFFLTFPFKPAEQE